MPLGSSQGTSKEGAALSPQNDAFQEHEKSPQILIAWAPVSLLLLLLLAQGLCSMSAESLVEFCQVHPRTGLQLRAGRAWRA